MIAQRKNKSNVRMGPGSGPVLRLIDAAVVDLDGDCAHMFTALILAAGVVAEYAGIPADHMHQNFSKARMMAADARKAGTFPIGDPE